MQLQVSVLNTRTHIPSEVSVLHRILHLLLILSYDGIQIQWSRSPGKKGSHFDPNSDLFVPNERKDVITSTVCWTAMAALLVGLGFVMGPIQLLKLYGVPYVVNSIPSHFSLFFTSF